MSDTPLTDALKRLLLEYNKNAKRLERELAAAKAECERLRKIAAHVPAMTYIAAKEAAGYGVKVRIDAMKGPEC